MEYNLVAPCLFGLESIVRYEISQLGGENIEVTDGRVFFTGNQEIIAKVNSWLRTGERVYIVLGQFQATTFTELFDATAQLPFEDFIREEDEFPIKGWSINSQLESVPSCQSIIKKAAVTRLSQVYKRDIFPESGVLTQISFSIHKNQVAILLDTTGDPLHKRGYRKNANLAPIRESLAAGIVDLARIEEDSQVYDPLCGSGTLLIEAAQRALNIAPGLYRSFDIEKWKIYDSKLWKRVREEARGQRRSQADFRAYGSDIDPDALKAGRENAKLAGVADYVQFQLQDVKDFKIPEKGIVITNPPYGERLLEEDEVMELYRTMGTVFPKKKGLTYYIIGPTGIFEPAFGRRADRRRKLYNGMIETQLYMYYK